MKAPGPAGAGTTGDRRANRNQLWARTFVEELERAGVREFCVAPGSRSTPLVLACAALSRVRVTSHLDERSTAFFALGMARATGRPAAVVTTSGTATGNLLPAVMEASQAEIPLILLTADRPPHLREADANQAVDQVRLYGSYVRRFFDVEPPRVEGRSLRHLRVLAARAVADALGAPGGPVHVNFPFEKPLEPSPVAGDVPEDFPAEHPRAADGRPGGREPYVHVTRRRSAATPDVVQRLLARLQGSEAGIVVAGPVPEPGRTGRALRRLCAVTGLPLLADPLSGARFGPGSRTEGGAPVINGYDLFLRHSAVRAGLRPDLVIRVGAAPTSAALTGFLDECGDARQIVVDDGHRFKDHLSVAREYVRADPVSVLDHLAEASPGRVPEAWTARWRELDAVTGETVADELNGELFEGAVLATVVSSLPEGDALFVSSSMPVRDLDAFGGGAGSLEVFGNRGASGIDGIVSTALGVARGLGARPEGAREAGAREDRREVHLTAVLGDLAFCHDMNGLLAAKRRLGSVTFVVINNDGGGIFHMLPIREHDPPFTELFATPHGLDLRHAAELYELPYERVSDLEGLRRVLNGGASGGSRIVEIRTDREDNRRRREEVVAAVGRAAAALDRRV